MDPEQLRYIFIQVHNGRGNHGSFLRAFANAYLCADLFNEMILREAARELVHKYPVLATYSSTEESHAKS